MTTINGDVGNSFSGGNVTGDLNQFFIQLLRDAVAGKALSPETIQRLQRLHVATERSDAAARTLAAEKAIALLGEPGSGRWITGIALLAGLGVTPQTVVLDREDLRPSLAVEGGCGYLLDLEETSGQLSPAVGFWIQDLADRLRGMGSYLVVRAPIGDWRGLGLDEHAMATVTIDAPRATAVFASHLKALTNELVATDWSRREAIVQHLSGARPRDAVRLAGIVHTVLLNGTQEAQQQAEALAAYANWTDELDHWFRSHEGDVGGYHRALLIATAALNNSPAATVCRAADRLAQIVELPRAPGAALIGPDMTTLVSAIDADLRSDRVCFTRPAYAESVLDYVWQRRPQMQTALTQWLAELPILARHGAQAAQSLIWLAIRQGDADLITSAAASWTGSQQLRQLAADALTLAAMNERIGRQVRSRLYDWATSATAPENLHLTVAQVCSGQLAQAFPQIVLTRLRHLAVRHSTRVKDAAIDALAALIRDARLRSAVLREVARWVDEDEPRRSTGRRAFLRITAVRDDKDCIVIVPEATNGHIRTLIALWRDALRHPAPDGVVDASAIAWLEAAAQAPEQRKTILEVLAGTCESSLDLGSLTKITLDWLRTADGPSQTPREDISRELLQIAQRRDRLGVPISLFGEAS